MKIPKEEILRKIPKNIHDLRRAVKRDKRELLDQSFSETRGAAKNLEILIL